MKERSGQDLQEMIDALSEAMENPACYARIDSSDGDTHREGEERSAGGRSGSTIDPPEGYLGSEGRVKSGPSQSLVGAGYRLELADARILHEGLGLADLAQPSTFGYYLAGFAEQATRDLQRIRRCYRWVNMSPAGSGGVGGTSIPVSRVRMAGRLGFEQPTDHIRDGMLVRRRDDRLRGGCCAGGAQRRSSCGGS